MPYTQYAETMHLEHTLGRNDRTLQRPSSVHVAFCSSDPGEAGSQTGEITNSTRRAIVFGAPSHTAGPPHYSEVSGPASDDTFSTTNWDDGLPISHIAIADAATTGNYLYYEQLGAPVSFTAGDNLTLPTNGIVCRLIDNVATGFHMPEAAKTAWLNHLLRQSAGGGAWAYTANCDASLHTGAPGDNGAFEFTGGGYTREQYTPSAVSTGDPSTISNSNLITFSNIQGNLTLTHWGLWNGAIFAYTSDQEPDRPIVNGSDVEGQIGAITVGVN